MNLDDLRNLISYNPETGHLYWIAQGRGRIKKKPAGTTTSSGYLGVMIHGKRVYSHRICWALHYGTWPVEQIDHINGVKSDNRIINLREATNSQNGKNLKLSSRNTSGVSGVHFDNWAGKWRASIKVDGRSINLGRWNDKQEAISARKKAEILYFGEWMRDR